MSSKGKFLTLLVLVFGISLGLYAQDDPFIGSWRNPKTQTVNQYEPAGDGKMKVTVTTTKGAHSRVEVYDGKPYPVEGEEGTDAVSVTRIDSHTIQGENWYQGKPRARYTVTVSKDGKTLTKTIKGTKADGQAYEDVRVSHKE